MLDLNKDKKGGLAKTHKNALKVVQDLSESLELSDAWRPRDILGANGNPTSTADLTFFL